MSDERIIPITDQVVRVPTPNTGSAGAPTNAYLVGRSPVLVIDPGSTAGAETLHAALSQRGHPTVQAIVLTHAHRDHAGGAGALREATGAPVWLHPAEMAGLADDGLDLPIDHKLRGGQVFEIDGLALEVVETPGHAAGHVVLIERASGLTFAGDLVAGAGTVAVTPPFGDMRAYLDSLERLRQRGVGRLLPGHGAPLDNGQEALDRFIKRRLNREAEILALVNMGISNVDEIVAQLYPILRPELRRAASGTVVAHLNMLIGDGLVRCERDEQTFRYYPGSSP